MHYSTLYTLRFPWLFFPFSPSQFTWDKTFCSNRNFRGLRLYMSIWDGVRCLLLSLAVLPQEETGNEKPIKVPESEELLIVGLDKHGSLHSRLTAGTGGRERATAYIIKVARSSWHCVWSRLFTENKAVHSTSPNFLPVCSYRTPQCWLPLLTV